MRDGVERRRHIRAPLALPVVLMTPKGAIKAKTADISISGLALILVSEAPKIDDEFKITIKPSEDHEISVTCEKVWSGSIIVDESLYIGIGARFTKIASNDRKTLASLVEKFYLT